MHSLHPRHPCRALELGDRCGGGADGGLGNSTLAGSTVVELDPRC